MKLYFFGADQCVTGSCHCLEVNGKRILIDCGLQQGRDEIDNHELPFEPNTIDYILITHSHIDHSGRVPMLIKQGFTGQIWTTRLTARLLEIMLIDSASAQDALPLIFEKNSCLEASLATEREITLALQFSPFKSTSNSVLAYCDPCVIIFSRTSKLAPAFNSPLVIRFVESIPLICVVSISIRAFSSQ